MAAGSFSGDALTGIRSFIEFSKDPNIKEVIEVFGKASSENLEKAYDSGFKC